MKSKFMKQWGLWMAAIMAATMISPMDVVATGTDSVEKTEAASTEVASTEVKVLTPEQICENEMLATEEDIKWYQVNITKAGYFTVRMTTSSTDSNAIGNGWNFGLYKNMTDAEPIRSQDFRTGADLGRTGKCYFETGIYYIKVKAGRSNAGWHGPTAVPYNIVVNETAQDYCETEGNETREEADLIKTNQEYTASTYKMYDVDWFAFDITKAGYFTVTLRTNEMKDLVNAGWNYYIYKAGETTPLRSYTNVTAGQTSTALPYEKGRYYVKVCTWASGLQVSMDKDAPIDVDYTIKVNENASANWESENNNTQETADSIKTGNVYRGLILNAKDTDWYAVTISKKGYFNVTLDTEAATSDVGAGWKVSVYEKGNPKPIKVMNSIKQKTASIELPYSAGTYWIEVKGQESGTAGIVNPPKEIIYKLSVNETNGNWESENNNSKETADKINVNTTYTGSFQNKADEDYYRVTLPKNSIVTLYAGRNSKTSSAEVAKGWKVTLYDKNMKKVTDFVAKEWKAYQKLNLNKGTYYVMIKGAQPSYESNLLVDKKYNLQVKTVSGDVTSVKAAATSDTSIKLSWSAVKSASGYQIYRSTGSKGKYKLVGTVKGGSTKTFTDKKLICGKNYYYKIKSYVKSNGKTTYGAYSKVIKKQATPAKVTLKSVSSKKKGTEKLTWKKVSGASGYVVYRSSSQNGQYKAAATIKNGRTTSYTDKVKGGRNYYYKVKAYKTVGKKKILGESSSVKYARAKK